MKNISSMITSMLEGENFKPLMNYLPTGRTTSVSGCGVDDNDFGLGEVAEHKS